MDNNKTPGTDGLKPEFYRYFWNLLGSFMVNSFNYAFRNGTLSISQRQGIITLIPEKKKNTEYLKNWPPVPLLNVDYKIASKTIALRLEKILPNLIHPCQSGYVKRRFMGESIRLIADTMHFTKEKNIPGVAVFLAAFCSHVFFFCKFYFFTVINWFVFIHSFCLFAVGS